MEREEVSASAENLRTLCGIVKKLIRMRDYENCETLIRSAMGKHPHAPEPHNLIGILLEKKGDHPMAMRHFRAAWALDPAYIPARRNLECYGTFFSSGKCSYDAGDCPAEENETGFKA